MLISKDQTELDNRLHALIADFGLMPVLLGLSDACGVKALKAEQNHAIEISTAWIQAKDRIYAVYAEQKKNPSY